MFDTVLGLPVHPLVVHATVFAVPLAAVLVAGAALWPRFRRWAGPLPLAASVAGLILVPLSTSSGEDLEQHVQRSDLVERHAHMADQLLPWMAGLTAVAAVLAWIWYRDRFPRADSRPAPPARALLVGVAVLALITAAGTAVEVVRIGHSGAKAAWSGVAASAPSGR
jgi:hypothetical protein